MKPFPFDEFMGVVRNVLDSDQKTQDVKQAAAAQGKCVKKSSLSLSQDVQPQNAAKQHTTLRLKPGLLLSIQQGRDKATHKKLLIAAMGKMLGCGGDVQFSISQFQQQFNILAGQAVYGILAGFNHVKGFCPFRLKSFSSLLIGIPLNHI